MTVLLLSLLYSFRLTEALFQTVLLLAAVTTIGLALIVRCSRQLRDERILWLGNVYLLKLGVVSLLLFLGWIPELDPSSGSFGYDPQRYYYMAHDLVSGGFDTANFTHQLGYPGILYYYGAIFAAFGFNPIVPALCNTLVTLYATLVLMRLGYHIMGRVGPESWTLGLAMVIPEVCWYDALTSRETLCMALATISVVSLSGQYLGKSVRQSSTLDACVGVASAVGLGVIRTIVLIPVAMAVLADFILARTSRRARALHVALVALFLLAVLLAPAMAERLGTKRLSFADVPVMMARVQQVPDSAWSEKSIGRMLVPDSPLTILAYAPLRTALYFVAPLPNPRFSLGGLLASHWDDWQSLMTVLSSALFALCLPLAMAAVIESFEQSRLRTLTVPFLLIWMAVGGGNVIIHERYRIMGVLLFWSCVWLGRACPPKLIRTLYAAWAAIALAGGMFYVSVKLG